MASKDQKDRIRRKADELIVLLGLDPELWDVDFGQEGLRIEQVGTGRPIMPERLMPTTFEAALDHTIAVVTFYNQIARSANKPAATEVEK